jgi:cytoplasmic iron level regulating protein YaaA (DUF328/UPF0246 family)
MLTHKDPEVQAMLGLLENQRDHVMGIASAMAKENAELKARIAKLENSENQDGQCKLMYGRVYRSLLMVNLPTKQQAILLELG